MIDSCLYCYCSLHLSFSCHISRRHSSANKRPTSPQRCVPGKSSVCYEQACEGRLNGLHAVPHAPCNSFFRCFNGALVRVEECPKHQIFDGRRCVAERNFSCWSEGRGTCEGLEDGFHVSSDSGCRGFYLCHQSQFIRAYKCSPGLVFNGKECVDDRNYICSVRSRLPDCSTKLDGYYTGEKSGCRTFFYCRGGSQLSEHTCPGDNVFNGEQCVDPSLFRCPARMEENQQPGNLTNNVVRSRRSTDLDCSSRDDGFYFDETSKCRRFFHCRDGRRDSNGTCPQTQVFNGLQCVPEEEFECPATPEDCKGRDDGFYFDKPSSCRRFYQCINGRRDSSGTCPHNQVFNGLHCVSEEDYECPITPKVEECKHGGSGVFQDLMDGCRSYFQCLDGVKALYWCPEGELHDGKTCRPAHEVSCPSSSLCASRPDGHFVDTSRGCQGYFECMGGAVVRYGSCGPGEVHNGRACVPRLFFSCLGSDSGAVQYLERTDTQNDLETNEYIFDVEKSKVLSFLVPLIGKIHPPSESTPSRYLKGNKQTHDLETSPFTRLIGNVNMLNLLGPLTALKPPSNESSATRYSQGQGQAQNEPKRLKSIHQTDQTTGRSSEGRGYTQEGSEAPPSTQQAENTRLSSLVPSPTDDHQGTSLTLSL